MTALQNLLKDTLKRLAASAKEQEAYLRDLGTWPMADELALELDDIAGAAKPDLPERAQQMLDELDALLESMGGPNALWDGPSPYSAPEWVKVRELARQALTVMDAAPATARS